MSGGHSSQKSGVYTLPKEVEGDELLVRGNNLLRPEPFPKSELENSRFLQTVADLPLKHPYLESDMEVVSAEFEAVIEGATELSRLRPFGRGSVGIMGRRACQNDFCFRGAFSIPGSAVAVGSVAGAAPKRVTKTKPGSSTWSPVNLRSFVATTTTISEIECDYPGWLSLSRFV